MFLLAGNQAQGHTTDDWCSNSGSKRGCFSRSLGAGRAASGACPGFPQRCDQSVRKPLCAVEPHAPCKPPKVLFHAAVHLHYCCTRAMTGLCCCVEGCKYHHPDEGCSVAGLSTVSMQSSRHSKRPLRIGKASHRTRTTAHLKTIRCPAVPHSQTHRSLSTSALLPTSKPSNMGLLTSAGVSQVRPTMPGQTFTASLRYQAMADNNSPHTVPGSADNARPQHTPMQAPHPAAASSSPALQDLAVETDALLSTLQGSRELISQRSRGRPAAAAALHLGSSLADSSGTRYANVAGSW